MRQSDLIFSYVQLALQLFISTQYASMKCGKSLRQSPFYPLLHDCIKRYVVEIDDGSPRMGLVIALSYGMATVMCTCKVEPTSSSPHTQEFPLNSSLSSAIPFLILIHLQEQGTTADSSLLAYAVMERMDEESTYPSGARLRKKWQLLVKLSASLVACLDNHETISIFRLSKHYNSKYTASQYQLKLNICNYDEHVGGMCEEVRRKQATLLLINYLVAIYNEKMIARITNRVLPLARTYLSLPKLTHIPRASFSRVDKFNEFRTVLEHEIKEEAQNLADLSSYEKLFKSLGWKIKVQNTLVELSKRVDDYDVRLLSDIKAPTTFESGEEGDKASAEKEADIEMNEVTVCLTKLGSFRTMAIHTVVTKGFEITNINFATNYQHIKEHRLDIYAASSARDYIGPLIETLPQSLFSEMSSFISEELGVTTELLEALSQYCLDSEQGLYIGWLKDLKNVL